MKRKTIWVGGHVLEQESPIPAQQGLSSRRWAVGDRAKLHLPLPITHHSLHYPLNRHLHRHLHHHPIASITTSFGSLCVQVFWSWSTAAPWNRHVFQFPTDLISPYSILSTWLYRHSYVQLRSTIFNVPYKHILRPASSLGAEVSAPTSLQLWDTSFYISS